MKHNLVALKGEIEKATITIRDFNTPLSPINRRLRKDIEVNNTNSQWDLNIYRAHHLTIAEYIFFSRDHGPYAKTEHFQAWKNKCLFSGTLQALFPTFDQT